MKKVLSFFVLLAIWSFASGASVPFVADSNPPAFVDFNDGMFLVKEKANWTIAPITSSHWSVIDNPNPLLQFADDRIYILEPGVRPVIHGSIGCSDVYNTWASVYVWARSGSDQYIHTTQAVVQPRAKGPVSSSFIFFATTIRDLTAEDFEGGNPYIRFVVQQDGRLPISCQLHIEIEVQ